MNSLDQAFYRTRLSEELCSPVELRRLGYRYTKIIFTLGPATESDDILRDLIGRGVDAVRLNMAHADEEWTRASIRRIRRVCGEVGRQIAIIMDVKGPEIRTGDVPAPYALEPGDTISLTTSLAWCADELAGGRRSVSVNYPGLTRAVSPGSTILVDSGLLRFEVLETNDIAIMCRVLNRGHLGSRRHINLPGVYVDLPSLTDKDRADVRCGIEEDVDYFALSFVRKRDDVEALQAVIEAAGSSARVIAKIEDQSGLANLSEIVEAADGLMVARGDLGIEIPYEMLPLVQRKAVAVCLSRGKPVIIATQLLESMIESPMPTRAEITDVSNAICELADGIMLSGETSVGSYPTQSVEVLTRIAGRIEPACSFEMNSTIELVTPKAKMLRAAATLAQDLGGAAIVVFTRSGFLAQALSALRPYRVPIYAFTDVPDVFRHMLLLWGVEPFLMDFNDDPEETIRDAFDYALNQGWCSVGDHVIVVTNALARERVIDTIQLRQVEQPAGDVA